MAVFNTLSEAEAYKALLDGQMPLLADEAHVIDTLSSGRFVVGFYIGESLVDYA